jgi:hypothetical protein
VAGRVLLADLVARELNGTLLDRARDHHDAVEAREIPGRPGWTSTSPQRTGTS